MTQPIFLYMTVSNKEEAENIVKALLEEKLIPCANILSPHQAIYRWDGEVQNHEEVAVIMKSTADKFDAIEKLVKLKHSYDVPCLVSMNITHAHGPYLDWINENLK